MAFLIFFHGLICLGLLVVILMQSGRGGGLTENFAAAESMFGAKTNEFMVKATTVLTVFFLVTSLSLAYLSSRKEQSLIPDTVSRHTVTVPVDLPQEGTAGEDAMTLPATPDAAKVAGKEQVQTVPLETPAQQPAETK